ncbi:MAG: AAA family ATPase [Candidatus Delongbacteria bacterium]|nr:AAA family ATPase [Candidatus Delongbacteria bacterium]MBN2836630.1 AAA family ATPase [Candidatus Delongbacteria bacterium]
MNVDIRMITEQVEEKARFLDLLSTEIGKKIIGQRYMIERLLIGLFTGGHVLLEGVPGLAKTETVKALSSAINTSFKRIQFTPDLLPADLIGTMIYNQSTGKFETKKGPIFANIILADEINRSPAKVQAALLEAMQEKQVTIGENTYKIDEPFLVLATQNPIEQEGTYPLPEAQVDRFMLKIKITYPTPQEEIEVMRRVSQDESREINPVITQKEIFDVRNVVKSIYVDEKIEKYIIDIVNATRFPEKYNIADYKNYIEYGASPRASINLIKAARAHAFIKKRGFVTPEDIRAIGKDVMRHRIGITYEAEAEELTSEDIITKVFDSVEIP